MDAGEVTEEVSDKTWLLVKAVGHDVRILKKKYLDLVRVLTERVQKAQRESATTTRQLFERDGEICELEVNVRLCADDAVTVADLQKQLAARITQISNTEKSSSNLNRSLSSMTGRHSALRAELDSARAAIGRGERVIKDFVDSVCKWYSSLACTQSAYYRDRLNAVLDYAHQRHEYLGGFRVRASQDGHSVHIGDDDSDEERADRTPSFGA